MDKDFITFLIFALLIFISTSIGMAMSSYHEYLTDKSAMENGYEEVVEQGITLWKKQ